MVNVSDDGGSLGEGSPVGHLPLALLPLLHLRKTHTAQDGDDGGEDDCTFVLKQTLYKVPDSRIILTLVKCANAQMCKCVKVQMCKRVVRWNPKPFANCCITLYGRLGLIR